MGVLLKRVKTVLEVVKQLGLGGLWACLGIFSSNPWVSGWLIGMSVVHILLVLLGGLIKLVEHVGGGINSSINAAQEHMNG